MPLIRLCEQQHWHYVLRIEQQDYCRRRFRSGYRDWQRGRSFLLKPGTSWYGQVLLWKSHGFACQLAASWEPDCKEAWFVISDLPASPRLLSLYGLRMRVEATFQDTKSRRWLLVIFLAFWWTTHLGASCKHHGHAKLFDRSDRYDKSLLRLGHLWLRELLKRANRCLSHQAAAEVARLANCLPFHRTKEGLRFSIHVY